MTNKVVFSKLEPTKKVLTTISKTKLKFGGHIIRKEHVEKLTLKLLGSLPEWMLAVTHVKFHSSLYRNSFLVLNSVFGWFCSGLVGESIFQRMFCGKSFPSRGRALLFPLPFVLSWNWPMLWLIRLVELTSGIYIYIGMSGGLTSLSIYQWKQGEQ